MNVTEGGTFCFKVLISFYLHLGLSSGLFLSSFLYFITQTTLCHDKESVLHRYSLSRKQIQKELIKQNDSELNSRVLYYQGTNTTVQELFVTEGMVSPAECQYELSV
jgi:hypothetical protein